MRQRDGPGAQDHRAAGHTRLDRWAPCPIAAEGHDAHRLRAHPRKAGITPIVPGPRARRPRPLPGERRDRERTEAALCRPEDCRGIATRFDTLGQAGP
ncbi:hypothetical protein M446_6084 [Methylobacterium sp. 4-46]|nr:hypothetical protein M446_6084 [Methylobacterium sp. 4-46]